MRGIHLRYLVDDVRVVKGVGVFQQGSVAWVPQHLAIQLVASGDFEPVTTGPLARVFIVRIGQDKLPSAADEPLARVEPEGAGDFERELEEEERRLASAAPADDAKEPDPIVAKLVDDANGDPWNYAIRDQAIDKFWNEAGLDRLVAVVADETAPIKARFLACEILYERELTFVAKVGRDEVAAIYGRALVENLTGRANSWGLLWEHDDAGPVGVRFIMLGKAAIPVLRPLLDDARETMRYLGSEEATVGNAYHFRLKDYAAFYLGKITRTPITYKKKASDRDRAIAELAASLPPS